MIVVLFVTLPLLAVAITQAFFLADQRGLTAHYKRLWDNAEGRATALLQLNGWQQQRITVLQNCFVTRDKRQRKLEKAYRAQCKREYKLTKGFTQYVWELRPRPRAAHELEQMRYYKLHKHLRKYDKDFRLARMQAHVAISKGKHLLP